MAGSHNQMYHWALCKERRGEEKGGKRRGGEGRDTAIAALWQFGKWLFISGPRGARLCIPKVPCSPQGLLWTICINSFLFAAPKAKSPVINQFM